MTGITLLAPPGFMLSMKRWLLASSYTIVYGVPELLHLTAFTLLRRLRTHRPYNERLISLEHKFLNRADSYLHSWSHLFCSIFNITVHVEKRYDKVSSNERLLVVVLNQQSLLEGAIRSMITSDLAKCSICPTNERLLPHLFTFQNIEFAMLPFIGWNRALTGVVIRRGYTASTQAGLKKVIDRMRTFNDSFYISVEGKRSQDGKLNAYKKGAAIMAIESQCDILPITFHNAGNLWPYGEWRIRSGHAKIVLHKVISTKGMTILDKDKLTQKLRNIAESELIYQENLPKPTI